MSEKILLKSLVVALSQALVYAPLSLAGQLSLPSDNLVTSEISPEKYSNTVGQVADYQITVTATGNVGVKLVTTYHKSIGTEAYKNKIQHQRLHTQCHG